MIGTTLNVAAILLGGALGLLLRARLPERLRQTVVAGLALFTLAYGFQMFLKTGNALIALGSLLLGASLVFCVGPMSILGSIQDGLTGDYRLLAVKAVLDGFASLAFASSLGVGVLFSALVILAYQGGIALLAAQVQALVSQPMMDEMTAVGGIILLSIAISSLLEIKKIRSGNFLPALFIAPLIVWLLSVLGVE
jgi:uncharacterized membrane protein YqgA involved in biofilm formation